MLSALIEAKVNVVAVVTNPDKRRGRGGKTDASPAKKVALNHAIRVIESPADAVSFLDQHGTDGVTGIVVAYGRIIREPLLSAIPLVNLHFSLLPRWRGAAPVERAILAGDATTGSSIMQIEEGLDTGAVYGVERVDINDTETVEQLRSRLGVIGAAQIVRMLHDGFPAPTPQSGDPVHADKITSDDLRLNWFRTPVEVCRTIRLGGAFCSFRGQRLKVLDGEVVDDGRELERAVSLGEIEVVRLEPGSVIEVDKVGVVISVGFGSIRLLTVQPEGKKPMSAKDWANGVRPSVGEVFGSH